MYAAYEFIKFMTSHDANLAVAAGNTGYLPIRQSVAEDPAYEAYVADNGMEPELALANLKQTVGAN